MRKEVDMTATPSFKRASILIIDDSPLELRVLSKMLSPTYNIVLANNGKTGLEMVAKHDVDLILLDLYMPDISGFEVLKELKSSVFVSHIPIIIFTSSDLIEDEVKGLSLGASDFIRKPWSKRSCGCALACACSSYRK